MPPVLTSDPVAESFFEVLGHLTRDALDHGAPLHLPTSDDPLVRSVMDHTRAHLAEVTVLSVCAG
ncbi:MAG: AraC family transcriptional regulator [Acidimicrobiia bacterium]|nr:AraC family transcriptional regulator [Acidimicrobiia bacterium]